MSPMTMLRQDLPDAPASPPSTVSTPSNSDFSASSTNSSAGWASGFSLNQVLAASAGVMMSPSATGAPVFCVILSARLRRGMEVLLVTKSSGPCSLRNSSASPAPSTASPPFITTPSMSQRTPLRFRSAGSNSFDNAPVRPCPRPSPGLARAARPPGPAAPRAPGRIAAAPPGRVPGKWDPASRPGGYPRPEVPFPAGAAGPCTAFWFGIKPVVHAPGKGLPAYRYPASCATHKLWSWSSSTRRRW